MMTHPTRWLVGLLAAAALLALLWGVTQARCYFAATFPERFAACRYL